MDFRNWLPYLSLIFIGLSACQPEGQEAAPDVSGIEVEVRIRRFEQDLFTLDTNDLAAGLARLEAAYPTFSRIYFDNIIASRNPDVAPEGHEAYVQGFLTHPAVRHLYDTTQVLYRDLSGIEEQYRQAFQYFRYYFPRLPLPDITTFISEYSVAAFIYDSTSLGVGLDFFLGEDYPYQLYNPNNSNFSAYLTRTFNRDHLVSKSLLPLVEDLVGPPSGTRMLDLMIYNGKKLYLLDHLLPFVPDTVIMEVTEPQMEWLRSNELEMWAYFLSEDLLYSSEWQDIRKFVEYSPHSPGMPAEAPGRTANFVGWRIVEAFMRRQPDASLQDLLRAGDAQAILDRSRYKPGR